MLMVCVNTENVNVFRYKYSSRKNKSLKERKKKIEEENVYNKGIYVHVAYYVTNRFYLFSIFLSLLNHFASTIHSFYLY